MAEKLGILIDVDVRGGSEVKTLKRELDGLGGAGKTAAPGVDSVNKSVGGMTGAMKGLLAGGVLAIAGQQLLAFGKASVMAASDAQEMQSKFDTVFGDLGGKVTNELGAFAEASNRSNIELMGFAATLQDTLKPMGIAADEAAGFSVDLVKLGTDLASFNNMPMDEAMRRLQGTLIGSHENALAFGVVINENTLKAEMAAQGWDKLTGAQLEAAKVQARINLLMAGTTDAQGDAIKTADSYANQVKGMEAAMTDLQVSIGTALLPVMTDLVGLVTEAADRLTVAAGAAGAYNDQATEIITANVESAKSFEELIAEAEKIDEVGRMMGGLATTITGTNDAFKDGIVEVSKGLAGQADSFEQFEGVIESWSAKSRKALQDYAAAQGMTVEELYKMERGLILATEATQGHDAAMLNTVAAYQAAASSSGEVTEATWALAEAASGADAVLLQNYSSIQAINNANTEAAAATETHAEKVSQLQQLLGSLPSEKDIAVDLQVYGINSLERAQSLLNSLQNPMSASADPYGGLTPGESLPAVNPGDAYDRQFASGTDGWQQVPGGTGQPYPVTLHGGEMFNVIPAGQSGNSTSNSVSIVQNFNGTSPDTMAQARNGTMAALREAGITGFG